MSKILPEAKVTITVENLEGNVTRHIVPLAAKAELGISDAYDLETGRPVDEKHFGFSCYALYDVDQNLVVEEQRLSKEKYEDLIIDQARDILRARAQRRQTPGVDTTSICVVRGEN